MEPYRTFEEICEGLAAHREAWAKVRDEQNYMPLLAVLEHPYSFVVTRLVDVGSGLPTFLQAFFVYISISCPSIFGARRPLGGALTRLRPNYSNTVNHSTER